MCSWSLIAIVESCASGRKVMNGAASPAKEPVGEERSVERRCSGCPRL